MGFIQSLALPNFRSGRRLPGPVADSGCCRVHGQFPYPQCNESLYKLLRQVVVTPAEHIQMTHGAEVSGVDRLGGPSRRLLDWRLPRAGLIEGSAFTCARHQETIVLVASLRLSLFLQLLQVTPLTALR